MMTAIEQEMAQMRAEVAAIDQEILRLVARRLETTRRIGEAKQKLSLPIRDFRVEVEVLSRARSCARASGFDAELAEQILEQLVRAAVQTQAEIPHRPPRTGEQKVLVVGGAGRMGAWLCRFFEAQGHTVAVHDPAARESPWPSVPLEQAVPASDVVVLATPLGSTPGALERTLEMGGEPLIFDICSLKSGVAPILRAAAARGRRVTSLHPMFAPGAVLLHGRAVLVCDAGQRQATEAARQLFTDTALGLYEVPLEEHDRIMAVVLGMSHVVNLQFALALSRFGLPFDFLGKVASTTFAKQIKTTAEVAEENPVLYHEIQYHNQHTRKMFELLSEALEQLRSAALTGQHEHFIRLMREGARYLRPTSASGEDPPAG
ncbi:MAG: prephenate dehydrogenase/arogenate dehydrogenase family protein [Armatimonadetes bacterium]|nr:prephenate dehydrogenase/arogenate dehydrogenase family protein [Armatimonadota bacterium]